MSWEMLSAIGQLIAVLIGIPSLIYLAIQIRNQGKESQRAAASMLMAHWTDFRKSMSDNADLAAIHLRGLRSFEELDPVEKLRFGSALGRLFVLSEGLYLFYLDGALPSELWKTFEQTTADLIAYPGSRLGGLHGSTGILQDFVSSLTASLPKEESRRYTIATLNPNIKRPNQPMEPAH